MKLASCVMAALSIAVALAGVGCGTSKRPSPGKAGTRAASIPLPSWAPRNPSPEFLRAAQVLKPKPEIASSDASATETRKRRAMEYMTYPSLYEFFGTLSDRQLQEFLNSGETRIPVKQLTTSQRKALDAYFRAYREAHEDDPIPELQDMLIELYRDGAAQDLANVDVGFSRRTSSSSGHLVSLNFWIRKPGGDGWGVAIAFAYR